MPAGSPADTALPVLDSSCTFKTYSNHPRRPFPLSFFSSGFLRRWILFTKRSGIEPYQPHSRERDLWRGGATRELTHDLVVRIKETTSLDPVPHLTCVCHKEHEITEILDRYARAGVSNILSLGGDPPKELAYRKEDDDFRHAADLVRFIKSFNGSGSHPDRRGFGIGVAGFPEGHPGTPNRLLEMDYLKRKSMRSHYIMTQLSLTIAIFDFRSCELAAITVPIIAGIIPNLDQRNGHHGRTCRGS
jgi:methylenetetrahydrofolate reductase (NADPH)